MKKLITITLGVLLSLNLFSQVNESKLMGKDIKLKVENGYKYVPKKQLSTRVGDTLCSSYDLTNTLFDFIQQQLSDNKVTVKGNWYQANPDPLATFIKSSNTVNNKYFFSKVVMKFDKIVKNVFTATSVDTIIPSKSTIRLDSLTIFGNIDRDTTEIDSVKNDSLIISVYSSSNGVLGAKIFDSIYTGNQLKKFMIGKQSIGSRKIPFKHQFAKGQTFSISIQYKSSLPNNGFLVCHGYADSCGGLDAVRPKLFYNMAEYYFWDSASPTSVVESSAIPNNFGSFNATKPTNCSYIKRQTYYIIPEVTICEELQGTIAILPSLPCFNQNATAYSIISGGKPPYTYSWTTTGGITLSTTNLDSANFVMNANGGNIKVTVTDAASNSIVLFKTISSTSPALNSIVYTPNSTSLKDCKDSIIITINSNPGTTFAWSSSNTTNKEVAKKAGKYTVTLTANPSGCKFDTTITITSSFSYPTLDFSFTPSTACPNEDVTFTIASSAYRTGWDYTWKDGTTSLGTVNPLTTKFTSSGTKKIYLSADSNGCSATDVFKNFVVKTTTQCKPTVSIQGATINTAKIYPNPVKNGEINIESAQTGKMQVRIIDILGKQIQSNEFKNAGVNKLDVSNLGNGVYFVELETKQGKQIEKIIVDK